MTIVVPASRTAESARSREDSARLLAIALLISLGVVAIVVTAWSVARGGIGWDSRLDTAWALEARSVDSSSSLAEAYEKVPVTSEFYGVFLYQFADVLHLLTTGSTEPLGSDTAVTYLYQGAANLILSLVSVTALAVAVAIAFRSLLAGAFAWSLTLATPLWLGMTQVDFKDLPVAAGVTLVTAGLILSFATGPPLKASLIGVFVAGSGGAIALATRAGTLVLLVALVGGTLIPVLVWGIGRRRELAVVPVALTSLSVLVCAFVFTWATNPIARIDMPRWLEDSFEVARSYPWDSGTIRVAGKDFRSADLPWWYVPAWLGAQLPLLTLAAVAGGLAVLVVHLVRRRRLVGAETTIPLVPLALQGLFLPAVIVLSGAVLYDGIRHLLFVVPALVAIAAAALAVLEHRMTGRNRRLRAALPVGAIVVVAASLCASIRWAPYSYAYINPVAGRNQDGRSWELDYWGVSGREGIRRLRELGFTSVYTAPTAMVGIPWGAVNDQVTSGPHTGLYVFLRWTRAADYGCTVIFTIERDGHVLGEGARCPPAPAG